MTEPIELDPALLKTIDRCISNASDVITARLDGLQKAADTFQADMTRVPTQVDRAVSGLREVVESRMLGMANLSEQRFATVKEGAQNMFLLWNERQRVLDERFQSRDERLEENLRRSKESVESTLLSFKEAMDKTERSFTRGLEAIQTLRDADKRAGDDKTGDIKDRLTAIESRTAGITTANTENRVVNTDYSTRIIAIVAVVVGAAVGFGQIMTQMQQNQLSQHIARSPVESRDLDQLARQIQDLQTRVDALKPAAR